MNYCYYRSGHTLLSSQTLNKGKHLPRQRWSNPNSSTSASYVHSDYPGEQLAVLRLLAHYLRSGQSRPQRSDDLPASCTSPYALRGFIFALNSLRALMFQRQISSSGGSNALATRHSVRRRMTWDRSLPDEVVAALWESPESVLRRGSCLQNKARTTVARVEFASRSYLLKYHHLGRLVEDAVQIARHFTESPQF